MCTDHSHRIWTLFWSHYSSLKILYVCVILKQGPASWLRYNSVLVIGCSIHSDEFLSNFYINKLILQNYRKISSIFSLKKNPRNSLCLWIIQTFPEKDFARRKWEITNRYLLFLVLVLQKDPWLRMISLSNHVEIWRVVSLVIGKLGTPPPPNIFCPM